MTVSLEDIVLEAPLENALVDPMNWFESPGPFELEIGCGKGGFLLSRAKTHPNIRLLGIEWANKYFLFCADRMRRWQLRNVRIMRTDARSFVMRHLPPSCVSALHIYHPDPWPKKRHNKRRLFQPDFLQAACNVLEPKGLLLVQSDHREYFDSILNLLGRHPALEQVPWSEVFGACGPEWAGTNFEIKYALEGREIHRAAFRRR